MDHGQDALTRALHLVGHAIVALIDVILLAFAALVGWTRGFLNELGIGHQGQGVVLIVLAVLFILTAFRLVGGLFRVLIILFLVLFAIQILVPMRPI